MFPSVGEESLFGGYGFILMGFHFICRQETFSFLPSTNCGLGGMRCFSYLYSGPPLQRLR